jgi:hypothetical protein
MNNPYDTNNYDTINSYETDDGDVVLEYIDNDDEYENQREQEMAAAADRYWRFQSEKYYGNE